MSLTFETILEDCSYVLVEKIVSTTLGTAIPAGAATVTPASMTAIYAGALLIVGVGASVEVVTVTSTTLTSLTAGFANAHLATDPVIGATFSSGQNTDAPLFYQNEMILYLSEVQNDFLLKVRPIYAVSNQNTTVGQQVYPQPIRCIRMERIAINPNPTGNGVTMDLYETSQASLDLSNPSWQGTQGIPQQWFRDRVDTGNFGVYPIPSATFSMEQWYSYRGSVTGNTLTTTLLVPDVFRQFMDFGVLARCFSKDGETRSPDRAIYFQKRYDLGVVLAQKLMTSLGVNMEQGFAHDQDFSPMPVQA